MNLRSILVGIFALVLVAGIGIHVARVTAQEGGREERQGRREQPAPSDLDKVEQMAQLVRRIFELCHAQDATIIMSELALMDAAKDSDIDAPAELEEMLSTIQRLPETNEHKDALVRFTRFLIHRAHREAGNDQDAADALQTIVSEAVGE